eukprot:gnl/Dysnectes_brevis/5312_a7578_422.p1 GENE.gnl/Dysnectes_brevis/5312_a7578_422~~gnl/Dysnectes_brevis/5312_a7578_422.p1  ORF type:complete len:213 (-),score=65.66 gnl/Dysnectes_brevis/5312_a7578_422:80-718(-)
MDEVLDHVEDAKRQISIFQRQFKKLGTIPQSSPEFLSVQRNCQSSLDRAGDYLRSSASAGRKLVGLDRRKSEAAIKHAQNDLREAQGELRHLVSKAPPQESAESSAAARRSGVAQRHSKYQSYLGDIDTHMDEAEQIGEGVLEELGRQKKHLKNTGGAATDIRGEMVRANQILMRMKKRERRANITFYALSALLLAVDVGGWFLYHHTKPAE